MCVGVCFLYNKYMFCIHFSVPSLDVVNEWVSACNASFRSHSPSESDEHFQYNVVYVAVLCAVWVFISYCTLPVRVQKTGRPPARRMPSHADGCSSTTPRRCGLHAAWRPASRLSLLRCASAFDTTEDVRQQQRRQQQTE